MATKVHIVILPYPAQGHLPPLIHLAHKLAAQGVVVTLVNVESVHKQLLKSWSCPDELQIRLRSVPFGLDIPMGYDASCQQEQARLTFPRFIAQVQLHFEALLETLEPPVCCILADEFISWTRATAAKFGVPSVSYFPGNAAFSSVHRHIGLIASNEDLPLKEGAADYRVTYIPGIPSVRVTDFPEYFHKVPKEALQAYAELPGHMKDATWTFVNSFYELEPEAFRAMREELGSSFLPVGPLFPLEDTEEKAPNTSLREEENGCLTWLDKQAPSSVLYIAFGSCSLLKKHDFEEFAYGLLASNVKFLWVIRPDMVQEEMVGFYNKLVETSGSNEQGRLVAWAPQLQVLKHKSVGGFLTHTGWNSTLEAISHGVVMICWPRHSDQALNAKVVEEDLKIGNRMQEPVQRSAVEEMIRSFMDLKVTEAMRQRVAKLREAAMDAASPGGSSSRSIEALVASLRS